MKSFLYLIGGTSLAQLITIAASPLLSRIFSPTDFGTFAILTTVVYFLTAFSCLRLDFALLSSENFTELKWLLRKSLDILLVISLFIVFSVAVFYFFQKQYLEILIFIPIMVFFSGLFNILNNLTLKLQLTNINAKSKVLQSGGGVLSQLILGLYQLGFKGMAIGQILGFIYSVTYLFQKNINFFKEIFKLNNTNYKISTYKRYILYDSVGAGFSVIANHLPTLFISAILGANFGGSYYMAYRVLMLPISVISISISQFISSKYFEWKINGVYHDNLKKILNFMSILVFIPSFLAIFILPDLFSYILGSNWALAGRIAAICIIWIAIKFIFDSLIITLSLDKGQKIALIFQIFLTFIRILSLWVGWKLNLDYFYIIKIFCYVSLFSYFSGILIISYVEKIRLYEFIENFLIGLVSYILIYISLEKLFFMYFLMFLIFLFWFLRLRTSVIIFKEVLR